jgi:hypothetical protein
MTDEPCTDGVRDADESDVDCGGLGECARCTTGNRCTESSDCESGFCASDRCAEPSCSDHIKNQDESDVDCGGACQACAEAAHCDQAADCDSGVCSDDDMCLADIEIPASDVIDAFEDGDLSLPADPPLGGRIGTWYAYGDATGVSRLEVLAIERGAGSTKVLRASGEGFTSWGSGFGVDLDNAGVGASSKLSYDAADYAGVTFRARAQSPLTLTLALPDADTDSAGGICAICEHHYAKAVPVTTSWQRFTVAFADLVLEPGGAPSPAAFDPSRVFSLRFQFAAGEDYDLAIDDVAFVTK